MLQSNTDTSLDSSNASLITLVESAAKLNDVDGIKATIRLAQAGPVFRDVLAAGLNGAAKHGCVAAVECILTQGERVIRPEDLLRPLFEAVDGDHVQVVQQLLRAGAPLNQSYGGHPVWNCWSAVMFAAWKHHFQTLQALLSGGADLDAQDHHRQTVLHCLASDLEWQDEDDGVLEFLIRHTRSIRSRDEDGRTPLNWACQMNKTQVVRRLLQHPEGQSSIGILNDAGSNALHIAVQQSELDIAELLLANGADPNKPRINGWSSLHIACGQGDKGMVSLLLAYRANVNSTTPNDSTPLYLAIQSGRIDVLQVLMEQNLETRDTFGNHFFFRAAELGQREMMDLLIPSADRKVCDMFSAIVASFSTRTGRLEPHEIRLSLLLDEFNSVISTSVHEPCWIHLPANNPTWIETLLMRHLMHDIDDNVKELKELCSLGLNHSHRGQHAHSRFHRPVCQVVGKHIWACIPYLHFETVERYMKMQDAIDQAESSNGTSLTFRELTGDELLVGTYPPSSTGGMHIRRTLDQFLYPNLDTRRRDVDQVVFHHQLRANSAEPKIYMVDQLWVLILDGNTVITSFPQRWEQPANDRFDILGAVLDTVKQRPIGNALGLVSLITDRCCGVFDRHAPHDPDYQFLAMIEASVGLTAEREAVRFEDLRKASSQASAWLKGNRSLRRFHNGQDDNDNRQSNKPIFVDRFLDFSSETDLLFEIKDIRGEIGILHTVLDHQQAILPELASRIFEMVGVLGVVTSNSIRQQGQSIDMYIKDLDRMDRQAGHLYESVAGLLDLKQKHANPFEARLAREQAADAARQGKTIMIFTIVTIVFLPLSFITSFFTIEVADFPTMPGTDRLPLSFVSKYIFGVGLAIAIPLVLLAFAAQDFKLGFRALNNFYQQKKKQIPMPDIIKDRAKGWESASRGSSIRMRRLKRDQVEV